VTVGRVTLVTPSFENNSTGRTYCLWSLAKQLGLETRVVGVKGSRIWGPLAGGAFADDCELLAGMSTAGRRRRLDEAGRWSDVLIAVKPLPTSFGVAAEVAARTARPLVVDVDDPDFEYRLRWQPARRRLRDRVTGRRAALLHLRRALGSYPVMVSNPVLQQTYGGVVVPHARPARPAPADPSGGQLTIRFVGSIQDHMGLDVLREAIAVVHDEGFRLEVSGAAPRDARPWEHWFGQTTFEQGQELVRGADLVVLPSLPRSWALAQLPAKLVDAMMCGRPVIASDLMPIRWALGGCGALVPPGDVGALVSALRRFHDVDRRRELGLRAHQRAVREFSLTAVAPALERVLEASVHRPGPSGRTL